MTAITAPRTATDGLARLAIRIDGVVVGLLAVAMIVAAALTPSFTGLPVAVEYVIGAVSVPYLPLAFWLASRRHVRRSAIVLAEFNAATTVGMLAMALTGVGGLTATGKELAIAVALYTAAIALLQYGGARRA